ncbi:hypothetical protein SAMN05216273_1183 [Chryseobacterium taihuense]|uniref:Uncharacterized protein n=1 Tax=Chryseobacterium taihuense TaxID=1141221 RepID=A0ABY0R0X5_9FLAO|nr:hypothetical protein SAMN05216273_1183 [Chryseobacterium taihuense]
MRPSFDGLFFGANSRYRYSLFVISAAAFATAEITKELRHAAQSGLMYLCVLEIIIFIIF